MTSEDVAYIAGLFDGEGCVYIEERKPRSGSVFYFRVSITNTDYAVLDWVQKNCGGTIVTNDHPDRSNRLPCYAWRLGGNEAASFLKLIYPYLKIKAKRASLAIDFQLYAAVCRELGWESDSDECTVKKAYRDCLRKLNNPLQSKYT